MWLISDATAKLAKKRLSQRSVVDNLTADESHSLPIEVVHQYIRAQKFHN